MATHLLCISLRNYIDNHDIMKFVKQPLKLHLEKICYEFDRKTTRHSKLLPNSIRCLICGPSNCGKTNLIVGLLLHENGLYYKNLYLYSKTLYQPKYLFLEKVLYNVPEIEFLKFEENADVISAHHAKPDSVIIFDDVACENQNNIRDYFSMGRHKHIDCFYLNQTYSKIPKQLIRDNANLIILFKQDDINLRHVYDEHVSTDMSWSKFRELCLKIWKKSHNFIVIDKDCEKNKGCYRMKFDTFVILD